MMVDHGPRVVTHWRNRTSQAGMIPTCCPDFPGPHSTPPSPGAGSDLPGGGTSKRLLFCERLRPGGLLQPEEIATVTFLLLTRRLTSSIDHLEGRTTCFISKSSERNRSSVA